MPSRVHVWLKKHEMLLKKIFKNTIFKNHFEKQ